MSAVHLSQVSTRNKRAVLPFLRVLPLILLLLWRDRASVSVLLAFRLSQDTWSENPWLLSLHVPNRSLSWWQTWVSFPPILPGISHAEGTGRLCAALGSSAASLPERGPGHAVTVLGRCPWGGTARKCGHQNISLLSLARYQNGWGILVWNAAFLMSCYVFLTMAQMRSPLFFKSLSFFYLITSPCPLPPLPVAFLTTGREILWSKKLEWVVKIFLLPAISHSSLQLLHAPLVIFTCRMFFPPFFSCWARWCSFGFSSDKR